ncbi:MAG: site-specific DNA-methyltransferase, partial [Chloroflexota bacterium]|nr:site-specific DNA-methyltransferase [Chloroflexota bacterium]
MATGIQKTKWNGQVIIDNPTDDLTNIAQEATIHYHGKLPADEILATPPATVTPVWSGSTARNQLYFGDNLPILARLLQDPGVRGQVKLVYIDPPFSTNKVYKSRQQADAYSDTLTGAHYIEFLRRRLILLRELMAENSSIYVHLDQNMLFHIKVVMDEIFGAQNFRNLITRRKCNPKNYTRKTYGNISDHILYYAKSPKPVWNRAYIPWTEERAAKEYSCVEPDTGRRYKKVPVHAPGTRNGATGQPWRDMKPPPGKHWQYTPDRLDGMDARGEIYWSPTGNPRRKVYLDQSDGVAVQDIWLDVKDAHNQMVKITGYPTEKPHDLLTRIIKASSNKSDLVLDCFAGSGTTLAAASKLGRRWIGIDNSSEAIATILRRFAHGLQPMGDFVSKKKATDLPLFDFANLSKSQAHNDEKRQSQAIDDF